MRATPGIRQDLTDDDMARHRFGLPAARWQALAGRRYWITGAGTGYGRALAVALAAAGARVALTGRRAEKLDETRAALGPEGAARALALPADIRDETAMEAAAAAIEGAFGGLDGVVANAALPEPPAGPAPLATLAGEAWRRLLDTNVTGAWLTARAALPLMLNHGRARALFVTSEAGWAETPGFGPYNVSKAALNSLGMSFAAESAAAHRGKDVQMNVLVPGEARTEMNRGSAISPFAVCPMALLLLSHPPGGPNGRFFHRDGRHLAFAYAAAHDRPLF